MTGDIHNKSSMIPDNEPKRFKSLDDFKVLEEFPDTKSMAVAGSDGIIKYVNHAFVSAFSFRENDNLNDLNAEPNPGSIIEGLSFNSYSSFHCELFFAGSDADDAANYHTDIERIYIGEAEYFVFIFSSLDERLKLENKINTLHNALEYGNVPVIITDAAGIITYATKSFEQILNKNIELLFGHQLTEVLAAYLDEADIKEIAVCQQKGEKCTKIISAADDDQGQSYREIVINPVKKDNTDVLNFIVTANDITQYILKNRIIKHSEERQKSIINNISDLLLIVRSDKRGLFFENANDNFYETFSLKRERVLEKELEDVFDKHFLLILTQAIHNLEKYNTDFQEFRYRNYIREHDYLGSITFTDDQVHDHRIFIISLKDITEQLENEEKLRRAYQKETHLNKLKSSFLANMSHEIRTPLNAIVGYSELIEDDIKSGSIETAIDLFPYLKEGFNRLLDLVENILEVSIIQSGETEFEFIPVNVGDLLKTVRDKLLHLAEDKQVTMELDLRDTELRIKADIIKLEKIITVLADNAIKYNHEGGRVGLKTIADKKNLMILISDTGKGIAQENLTRMFEPFAQEDEGHTRKYEGAGLGLTIAYNLTRLMNGELMVESQINTGTTITLTFPLKKENDLNS